MTFLSLFAGIGGIDLGLERAGMRCVGQVEIEPHAVAVLAKHWPDVPRWNDVRTFTGAEVNEEVDLVTFGFPCQDLSYAGEGAGLDGARSGLFFEAMRIVRVTRPRFIFVENVAALLDRGMGRVLSEMAACGFDAEWECLPAHAFGAPHGRDRVFIVAYAPEGMRDRVLFPSPFDGEGLEQEYQRVRSVIRARLRGGKPPADFGRLRKDDGLSARVGEVAAYGNAVVPQIAEWIGRRIIGVNEP